jgi:divalent metal cation (Fe/Co/Zn/Cd) transporter
MAESLYTLLTSFSTLLSLLTMTAPERLRRSSAYGHGKRETILTFLLVAFFGFASLNLLAWSGQQLVVLTQGEKLAFPAHISLALIQLLGLVVVTSLGLAFFSIYNGRVLNNVALRFNAGQLLKDSLLTVLVVGGLLGVWSGLIWLDMVLAIMLVLLSMRSCWQVVSWHLPLLVQQTAIAPEVLAQIARQVGGIKHCYKIQSRGLVGRLVYVQMNLIVHPEVRGVTSLIVQRLEGEIRERFGPVQVTFHIDDDFTELVTLNQSGMTLEVNRNNE